MTRILVLFDRQSQVSEHRVFDIVQFSLHLGTFDLPNTPDAGGCETDSPTEADLDDCKAIRHESGDGSDAAAQDEKTSDGERFFDIKFVDTARNVNPVADVTD